MLTTGWASWLPQRTTRRLETIAALLLVQLDQAAFAQAGQGHFNGTDGTFNDHVAGVDDGGGLLALEHGGGDLRGVGQVSDAGF